MCSAPRVCGGHPARRRPPRRRTRRLPRRQSLRAACDVPAFATTLAPVGRRRAPLPARAVWLSQSLLQWPGAPAQGRFVLASSATGALVATTGAPLAGADDTQALTVSTAALPPPLAQRFKYLSPGVVLEAADAARVTRALRAQALVVREDDQGRVLEASALQVAGALDDAYAAAARLDDLGVTLAPAATRFTVWAPTAQAVRACVYPSAEGAATAVVEMTRDDATGAWRGQAPGRPAGGYYTYLVDVFVPGVGVVRNRVTDPYSISLNADSRRSWIGALADPALMPRDWRRDVAPATVRRSVDMAIYELHLRDFSMADASVPAAHRGKYLAFTDAGSAGMRHLHALADAGLTDVHLLPVFDIASVPERGCTTPKIAGGPAAETQQAAVVAGAATDCFNWGYDPFHYSAPEGSYASDADDGAVRVREFRAMVQGLHRAGLRVGMDVVYNHTSTSGQHAQSVLDRIVPGYYQRLDADGAIEHSTCCDNTATENLMMGKLLVDSVTQWAVQYHVDSFRFDLMGHQPRAVMEALQRRLAAATGREIPLIGEGWNFGEVADGARFVQASQLSLNGTGIGTFSDRARDAVRGGSSTDSSHLRADQGWINGEFYDPNEASHATRDDLLAAADMIRVGLAGSVRDMTLTTWRGQTLTLDHIPYGNQPAGYASAPGEAVNYVENHDNQTLYDINVFKLPLATSGAERARVQMLGAAINAFSQGVAYFHAWRRPAAVEVLRQEQLRFRRLVQPAGLDRHRQRLRRRPAAAAGQRRPVGDRAPAAGRPVAQAPSRRHRVDARRLPRPAAHPRQHAAVPPGHGRRRARARELSRQRPRAGAHGDRRADRRPRPGWCAVRRRAGRPQCRQEGARAEPGAARPPLAAASRAPRRAGGRHPNRPRGPRRRRDRPVHAAGAQRHRLRRALTRSGAPRFPRKFSPCTIPASSPPPS